VCPRNGKEKEGIPHERVRGSVIISGCIMNTASKAQRGFTVIEILAVIVILGTLLVVCLSRYVTLHDDAAYLVVQQAKNELDLREHIAWAKYKAGGMAWGDLQNADEITGGTKGFGDCRITDDALMGNN
jgi:prepilin-type N-terminal cleavage/methylation domain-containing protein